MKARTILLMLCILPAGAMYAQENYFTDSKLMLLLKEDLAKYKIVLDKNGNLPASANINTAPYETELIRSRKKEDAYAPAGTPPPAGALAAPPPAGALAAPLPALAGTTLSPAEKKQLEQELIAIAWLLQTHKDSELLKVKNFPAAFPLLHSISEFPENYLGHSANEKSAFAFNETAILYGITDFIIRRAKEQLVEAYLRGWYDKLSNNSIISPVLTQSLDVTKAFIADNSLNLAKYGDKWKAAIREDFHQIPSLLQQEPYLEKVITIFHPGLADNTKNELIATISGSMNITQRLYMKEHLVSGISGMASGYLTGTDRAAFKRLTVLADVLLGVAGTLENNDTYKTIQLDALRKLQPEEWLLLLKLTYARNSTQLRFTMGDAGSGIDLSGSVETLLGRFKMLLTEMVVIAQDFQKIVAAGKTTLTATDTRKLFEIAFRLYPVCVEFLAKNNIGMSAIAFNEEVEKYFRYAIEMGEGIAAQEYGKVLDGAIGVMNQLKKDRSDPALENTTAQLQRYGSFLLNILSAKEASEVEAALNELVPKGSYMVKNTKRFTMSLSAHPGILLGQETVKKYPVDNSGNIIPGSSKKPFHSFSAAPYLPIGIDFSFHPMSKNKLKARAQQNKHGSMNIGIQLVDLGAVLNYRLNSDTTVDSSPEIGFKQFFSPGAQVMWHFNNSPVVVGAACNYTPDLRKIAQDGFTYKANAVRYGVFVAVDVTFFHFFTSRKDSWAD